MSTEKYRMPVELEKHLKRSYKLLLKCLAVEKSNTVVEHCNRLFRVLSKMFDMLVYDMLLGGELSDYSKLVDFCFEALNSHDFITLSVLNDAICYSMWKQAIDGNVDESLLMIVFFSAKAANDKIAFETHVRDLLIEEMGAEDEIVSIVLSED